jgi:hypothetical protein
VLAPIAPGGTIVRPLLSLLLVDPLFRLLRSKAFVEHRRQKRTDWEKGALMAGCVTYVRLAGEIVCECFLGKEGEGFGRKIGFPRIIKGSEVTAGVISEKRKFCS